MARFEEFYVEYNRVLNITLTTQQHHIYINDQSLGLTKDQINQY